MYVMFTTSVGRGKYLNLEDLSATKKTEHFSVHLESVVMIWRLKGGDIAHHPREFVKFVNYNYLHLFTDHQRVNYNQKQSN